MAASNPHICNDFTRVMYLPSDFHSCNSLFLLKGVTRGFSLSQRENNSLDCQMRWKLVGSCWVPLVAESSELEHLKQSVHKAAATCQKCDYVTGTQVRIIMH